MNLKLKEKFLPSKGSNARLVLKNVFSLGLLQIVNYILPILIIPFLVYTIGLSNVGIIALATAFCTYFQVCIDYGFSLTATREIAKNKGDVLTVSSITSAVINIKIILSIILFMIFLLIINSIPSYSQNLMVFFITYALCVFQSFFPQWHFQATEKMIYITIANSIPKIISAFFLFFLIRTPEDTWKVQMIFLIGSIVSVFWAIIILKTRFNFTYSFDVEMIKKQFISGWSIFIARFFSTLYKNSNILIIGYLLSPTLLGAYAVAEKIIRAAQTVQNVIGDSLFPWIVKKSSGDERFFKVLHDKYRIIIYCVYLFSAIFVFLFSNLIAKLLVHNNWDIVSSQLKVMSLVFFFGGLNYFYGILGLVAHGFNKSFSLSVIATGIFNIIACYFLVLSFSVVGASITMVLSEALLLLLILFFIARSGITK